MKKVRIISLIMALAMVVTVLSGCNVTIGAKASLPATVDADGRFIYSIVRGDDSTDAISDAAKDIRTAVKENMGGKASIVKDGTLAAEDGSYEILLGDTNRPESAEALAVITESRKNNTYDFIIKVINNKICIQATTDNMVVKAAEWFVQTFCESTETWEELSPEYQFLYQPDVKTLATMVSGAPLSQFTVVKPRTMSYLIGMEVEELINIYSLNGEELKYVDEIESEAEYEILIGDTTREASKAVTVEGDNYVIKVIGKKLVVKGGNDLATYRAVKELCDTVEASKTGEGFDWSDGYVINGKYDADEKDIYTLNFADEFEGSKVDTSVWGDYNYAEYRPDASSLGGRRYTVTPMNQSAGYTSETGNAEIPQKLVFQSDGALVLGTLRVGNDFFGTYASTFNSTILRYGLWEIRSKLPQTPACISYWMNGTGEGGLKTRYGDLSRSAFTEIDLVENFGSNTWFASNVHRWWTDYQSDGQTTYLTHNSMDGVARYNTDGNNKSVNYKKSLYGDTLSDDWHTYTLYWDDTCMKFALDGKSYVTYNYADEQSVSIHSMMMYMIMSNGMGSPSYGATYKVDEHDTYFEHIIDYVRVYQTAAISSQLARGSGQWETVNAADTVLTYPDVPLTGVY